MLSVNVRYWTDYLDPETFSLTIEQSGQKPLRDAEFAPAKLAQGDEKDGRFGYDVLCEDSWRLKQDESAGATYGNYCRFFERYSLAGWTAAEVRVTFRAKTRTGETFEPPRDSGGSPKDSTLVRFELEPHQVNVVYFELEDSVLPGSVVAVGDSGVGDAAATMDASTTAVAVVDAGRSDPAVESGDGAVTTANPTSTDARQGSRRDAAVGLDAAPPPPVVARSDAGLVGDGAAASPSHTAAIDRDAAL